MRGQWTRYSDEESGEIWLHHPGLDVACWENPACWRAGPQVSLSEGMRSTMVLDVLSAGETYGREYTAKHLLLEHGTFDWEGVRVAVRLAAKVMSAGGRLSPNACVLGVIKRDFKGNDSGRVGISADRLGSSADSLVGIPMDLALGVPPLKLYEVDRTDPRHTEFRAHDDLLCLTLSYRCSCPIVSADRFVDWWDPECWRGDMLETKVGDVPLWLSAWAAQMKREMHDLRFHVTAREVRLGNKVALPLPWTLNDCQEEQLALAAVRLQDGLKAANYIVNEAQRRRTLRRQPEERGDDPLPALPCDMVEWNRGVALAQRQLLDSDVVSAPVVRRLRERLALLPHVDETVARLDTEGRS